jgi:cytochrome c556
MKKLVMVFLVVLLLSTATYAVSELRPIVKIMITRLYLMQSMTAEFALSNYEGLKMLADGLSAQAQKVGDGAPQGPVKELNYKLAGVAKALSDATAKRDGNLTAGNMGEILATCYACHAAVRDK